MKSVEPDGSTDSDNELVTAVYCDSNGGDEKVHNNTTYLSVLRPSSITADAWAVRMHEQILVFMKSVLTIASNLLGSGLMEYRLILLKKV